MSEEETTAGAAWRALLAAAGSLPDPEAPETSGGGEPWAWLVPRPADGLAAALASGSDTTGGKGAVPVLRSLAGDHCRTRATLFTTWARALDFPSHFGRNWDAFADCLTDLVWPELLDPAAEQAPGVSLVLAITEAHHLLADETERQWTTLLDVLTDVAGGRSAGGDSPLRSPNTPKLRVLFICPPAQADPLQQRMTHAGLHPHRTADPT